MSLRKEAWIIPTVPPQTHALYQGGVTPGKISLARGGRLIQIPTLDRRPDTGSGITPPPPPPDTPSPNEGYPWPKCSHRVRIPGTPPHMTLVTGGGGGGATPLCPTLRGGPPPHSPWGRLYAPYTGGLRIIDLRGNGVSPVGPLTPPPTPPPLPPPNTQPPPPPYRGGGRQFGYQPYPQHTEWGKVGVGWVGAHQVVLSYLWRFSPRLCSRMTQYD